MRFSRLVASIVVLVLAAVTVSAAAFEPGVTFAKGTFVLSGEGSYGEQFNMQDYHDWTGLKYWNVGLRGSILPFNPHGPSLLRGSIELGFEPLYQKYTEPSAYWAGLIAVVRYHFLSFGRLVPYVEGGVGAGGTDLDVREIESRFSFILWAGIGASVFITDAMAVYAGYRYEHNSNGNIDPPNRGWESHVGLVGVSYYFR